MKIKGLLRSLTAMALCMMVPLPAFSHAQTAAEARGTAITSIAAPFYRAGGPSTDITITTDALWTEEMGSFYEAIQQPASHPSNKVPTPDYMSEAVRSCILINGTPIGEVNTASLPNKILVRMQKDSVGRQTFYIIVYDGYLDPAVSPEEDFTLEIREGMVDMQNRPIAPVSKLWDASERAWVEYTPSNSTAITSIAAPFYRAGGPSTDITITTDAPWTEEMGSFYEAIQQPVSHPSNKVPTPDYMSEAVRNCILINGTPIGEVNTASLPNKILVRMQKDSAGRQTFYIIVYDGYLDPAVSPEEDFTLEIREGMVDMQNRPIAPVSKLWDASEKAWVEYTLSSGVAEVIQKIEAIGEVGRDSLPLIEAAEAAYAALPEFERKLVRNLSVLLKARQDFDSIDKLTALPPASFDEEQVVLTFGAVSDTHNNNNHIPTALKILKERAAGGLDALVIAGDIADQPVYGQTFSELPVVKQTFENYVDDDVPIFFSLGNHDSSAGSNAAVFYDTLGPRFYMADLDQETARATGNRHAIIGGYHFLAVEADYSKIDYTAETLAWAKKTLEEITADPAYDGKPIFVVTHISSKDTVHGSTRSTGLADILKHYPQAIALTGHSHYSIHDERAIMQTGFTTVNLGAVNFLALEEEYLESLDQSLVENSYDLFTGTLIEVDASGNVRITRLDFANNALIKEPWIIPAPAEDGSHLLYYTGARGTVLNEAPVFSPDARAEALLSSQEKEKDLVELHIDAATDDDMVYCYRIDVFEMHADTPSATYRSITGFYNTPSVGEMPAVHTAVFQGLSQRPYQIEVRAIDAWGKTSRPIALTVDGDTRVVDGLPGNKKTTKLTAFNPPYHHENLGLTEFLVLTDADWSEELGDSYFEAIQNPHFTENPVQTPAAITEAINRYVRINGKTLAEINTEDSPNTVLVRMQRYAEANKQMFSFLIADDAIEGVSVDRAFTIEFLDGMVDMGNRPIKPAARQWEPSLGQWIAFQGTGTEPEPAPPSQPQPDPEPEPSKPDVPQTGASARSAAGALLAGCLALTAAVAARKRKHLNL